MIDGAYSRFVVTESFDIGVPGGSSRRLFIFVRFPQLYIG
jgi:hypothetical protein